MRRIVAQNPDLDERGNVDAAVKQLQEWGVLDAAGVSNHAAFEKLRAAVRRGFKIPWTSITPAMERLLYSIACVNRPRSVVGVGIFCGNTLVWNIGPACGPGKCYTARNLVGIELDPKKVEMARDNLHAIGIDETVQLIAADGHDVLRKVDYPIDLLYLDCDCPYKPMLEAAYEQLREGSLVVTHNTIHKSWVKQETSKEFLDYVRDASFFRESVSVEPDDLGIEVTVR